MYCFFTCLPRTPTVFFLTKKRNPSPPPPLIFSVFFSFSSRRGQSMLQDQIDHQEFGSFVQLLLTTQSSQTFVPPPITREHPTFYPCPQHSCMLWPSTGTLMRLMLSPDTDAGYGFLARRYLMHALTLCNEHSAAASWFLGQ